MWVKKRLMFHAKEHSGISQTVYYYELGNWHRRVYNGNFKYSRQ